MTSPALDLIAGRAPNRCVVIAELGVNHDGRLDRALKLLDAAAEAGADAVKLQLFVPTELCSRLHRADELAMLERLRLTEEDHARIVAAGRHRGMAVFATPFDEPSLALLRRLEIPLIKVGSGEVTHTPLLRSISATGLPVILSTGGCEWPDLDRAVAILRGSGSIAAGSASERSSFTELCEKTRDESIPRSDPHGASVSSSGRSAALSLLHCTSAYPPPDSEVNLRMIPALAGRYPGCVIGFSDHTLGPEAAVAAVALGARIVEKHLTLDCAAPGPDHAASADPAQFAALVAAVRRTERMLGDGRKVVQPCEGRIGRSIVAARDLPAGHVLSSADLAFKRPAHGLRPRDAEELVGRALPMPLPADEVLPPLA